MMIEMDTDYVTFVVIVVDIKSSKAKYSILVSVYILDVCLSFQNFCKICTKHTHKVNVEFSRHNTCRQ